MKKTINIIFIEDSTHDAGLISQQIEKEQIGFRKKLVDNKHDLIDAIESFEPDLIISGYMLANLTGMETLAIRNELSPSTPFIFVTDLVNETVAVECMKAGADDYLMKRNLSRLGETIKSAIRKKEIVTQKNKAEKMLKESEEKYRAMVEHLPDAVLVHSREQDPLLANSSALKLLGADTLEEIKQTDLTDFVHPDFRDSAKDRIRKVYETGRPQGYVESKYMNLRDEVIDVEVIGIPHHIHG